MQPLAASSGPDTHTHGASSDASATVWRVHLAAKDPGKIAGIVLVVLLGAGCALILFHNLAIVVVAAVLILVSAAEFLLPLTFTLDREGAKVSCGPVEWLGIKWTDVRSVYRTSYGVKLSPFASPKTARLENCRGIRLRVPPERVAEIEARIACLREES